MPLARAEEARAHLLSLFPAGFEEVERADRVEFAAYVEGPPPASLATMFGPLRELPVAPGWETRWRDFHRSVRIGRLWVGPPWEDPPADAVAVVIDPGLAFGTGGHASTRLCLELLAAEPVRGSVLDVGSGSGVLAIAAAKLGFAPVHAVDIDREAVRTTRENAEGNGVVVDARQLDAIAGPLPPATIALVNVSAEVAAAVVPQLRVESVVTAGYLAAERPALDGYRHTARRARDGWAADRWAATGEIDRHL